jgi:lysozyme
MIPGIDVSHWQGEIDWAKIAKSGVKFAFIKATEFPDRRITVFVDQNLKKNIQGTQQNNILWGAYHFFRTHIDPVIQAQVFCQTVGLFTSLPPVIDLEVAGSKGTPLNTKVLAFIQEVQRITDRTPIIYTSGGFWRSYMLFNRRVDTDWAQTYPLWLAQYTSNWPTIPYPWASWDFWQYSSNGRLPGIPGAVDLNWFIGSYDELVSRFVKDRNGIGKGVSELNHSEGSGQLEVGKMPSDDQPVKGFNLDSLDEEESDDDWIKRYFFSK